MDSTIAIQGIVEAIEAFRTLIFATAYVVGFFLCVLGIMKAREYAENPSQVPFRIPATMFIVGVLCLYMPSLLDSMLETFFQSTELSDFTYSGEGEQGQRLKMTMDAIIMFVQLVGLIGFFKGILLLKNIGAAGQQGDGAFAKAMTHLAGGALAINIVAVVGLFAATVGMDTSSWMG